MWLQSHVAVAMVKASGYSSDSSPGLGTFICFGCGPKKTKKERERKKERKEGRKEGKKGRKERKRKFLEFLLWHMISGISSVPRLRSDSGPGTMG